MNNGPKPTQNQFSIENTKAHQQHKATINYLLMLSRLLEPLPKQNSTFKYPQYYTIRFQIILWEIHIFRSYFRLIKTNAKSKKIYFFTLTKNNLFLTSKYGF